MSTRILILKDGVIKPASSSDDLGLGGGSSLVLGTTSSTAYRGDYGNIAYLHSQIVSGNPHGLTKSDIGLGNVANSLQLVASNNLSDLINRQTALNNLGGGVTSGNYLRANGTNILLSAIQASDIPTLNQNTTGTASNVTGTVAITNGGTGSSTQNFVDLTTTQTIGGNKTFTGTIAGITSTMVGLGNVNNTSDTNKPVSTAQQTALDLKAPLASPTFTGVVSISNSLILPTTSGTTIGNLWRNGSNLEFKDASNITQVILNSAGNLSNLSDKQVSLNNLVGNQTANRVLKSNGVNMVLAQVGLTTDVTGILPIANGGTGSATQNFVDLSNNQSIAGIKTFTNTTQSTSTTTGAQIIFGGQAIQGNLWVAGTINQNINYTFRAAASSNQSTNNSAWTKILFPNEIVDTNNQYDTTTSRITATTTEVWRISVYISFNITTSSRILTSIWKNGVEVGALSRVSDFQASTGPYALLSTIQEFPLVAGDYLEVYVYTNPSISSVADGTLSSVFWSGKRIN
jgi:hypothetical protein